MATRPDPPFLHDPLETLSIRALHRSASVSVFDVSCRPRDFQRGAEEWSRTHQIVFPRRGVFECEIRGQKLVADANRVLFFNRDEGYRVAHPARCGDECTVLTFADGLLESALGDLDPGRLDRRGPKFRFSHATAEPRVFALQAVLQRAGRARSPTCTEAASLEHMQAEPLAVDELAVALLEVLLRDTYRQWHAVVPRRQRVATTVLQHEQVARAQLLLATRFAEPLSLAEVASAVFCSPFHLARVFRRSSGLTLHQYRQRLRLHEALQRLAEGGADLSSLALDLGFASHSHFTDVFRKAFGLPPSACRGALGTRRLTEMSRRLTQGTTTARAGRRRWTSSFDASSRIEPRHVWHFVLQE